MFDRQKKLIKAIRKQQSKGISPGDICPRCGRPAMKADGKNHVLSDNGIYLCDQCYIDASLSELTGDTLELSSWAAFQSEITAAGEWKPATPPVPREILPRFKEGDRVIDTRSDWPGVVTQTLPQGLYVVSHDGDNQDECVLKDKELTYEMDEDFESYLGTIKDRIPVGTEICIILVKSEPGSQMNDKTGTVIDVSPDGGVHIKVADSNEMKTIYPDVDIFKILGGPLPQKESFADIGNDVTIEF